MRVIKFRDSNNRILYKSADRATDWLFIHCSNGFEAVPTIIYNKYIEPLLFDHGVGFIKTIDKTRTKINRS